MTSTYYMRWLIRRDFPQILEMQSIWDEARLIEAMRERNTVCMIVEHGEQIIGLMVYVLHKNHLQILRLFTHKEWRNKGVGKFMLERLMTKISPIGRHTLEMTLPETNLKGLVFLKRNGFRAVKLNRKKTVRDSILMRYTVAYTETNRISNYLEV